MRAGRVVAGLDRQAVGWTFWMARSVEAYADYCEKHIIRPRICPWFDCELLVGRIVITTCSSLTRGLAQDHAVFGRASAQARDTDPVMRSSKRRESCVRSLRLSKKKGCHGNANTQPEDGLIHRQPSRQHPEPPSGIAGLRR